MAICKKPIDNFEQESELGVWDFIVALFVRAPIAMYRKIFTDYYRR